MGFLTLALVLLWPLYRRILLGLGTAFALYGTCLLIVLLAGGNVKPSETASFLGGGLLLRVVGGIQPASFTRRRHQPAGKPKAANP